MRPIVPERARLHLPRLRRPHSRPLVVYGSLRLLGCFRWALRESFWFGSELCALWSSGGHPMGARCWRGWFWASSSTRDSSGGLIILCNSGPIECSKAFRSASRPVLVVRGQGCARETRPPLARARNSSPARSGPVGFWWRQQAPEAFAWGKRKLLAVSGGAYRGHGSEGRIALASSADRAATLH